MEKLIEEVRGMFRSMTDGETSASPYDTAWVALVPSLDGSERPQFPKTLHWIIDNQFADGSWGDSGYFSYFDHVCNTLACIVALETWHTGAAAVDRGVTFIQQNLQKMETEAEPHMMIGFEIVFPALIADAQKLGLNLPYDAPIIVALSAERQKKLKKIPWPMEEVHSFPTTLLNSLEVFHQEVNWETLLILQSENGSFFNSPAATAACLLHTKDEKALGYLNRLLERFNNAVPNLYPVDLFEHLWIVDRIQRLGIDRHFEREIKDSLDYVYKYYTTFGIGRAKGAAFQDLDDTAMGFRLLRQHGYEVNEDVFRQFRSKSGEFFCFANQSGQSVTGLFNFYRAAQTRFAGEALLKDAETFSRNFLEDKLTKNECFDKWIISKDLAGEVEYVLETPWYSSPPWLETRAYLNHYGPHDVWFEKSLYRMPLVNNETFLALAKANFNRCQSIHQQDLQQIARWDEQCDFQNLSYARQRYRECFFAAVMMFPPPELAPARLVYARCATLTTVLDDYFDIGGVMPDMKNFIAAARQWDPSLMDTAAKDAQITFNALYNSVNAMTREGMIYQGRDIGGHLRAAWLKWLEAALVEAEWTASGYWPSFDEYMETAQSTIGLEGLLMCSLFFLGEPVSDELVNSPKMLHLFELVNRVGRLMNDIQGHEREKLQGKPNAVSILQRENSDLTEEEVIAKIRGMIEKSMLEVVREAHRPSHIPKSIRQHHFNNARLVRMFYKDTDGISSLTAMKEHVKKILYEPVY